MSSAAVPLHIGDAWSGASTAGDPLSLFLSLRLSRFRSDRSFDDFDGFSFTAACGVAVAAAAALLSVVFWSSVALGSHVSTRAGGLVSSSSVCVSSEFFTGPLTSLLLSLTGVFVAVEGRLRFLFPCHIICTTVHSQCKSNVLKLCLKFMHMQHAFTVICVHTNTTQ